MILCVCVCVCVCVWFFGGCVCVCDRSVWVGVGGVGGVLVSLLLLIS